MAGFSRELETTYLSRERTPRGMRELWLVRKLDLAPWRANPYSAAAAGNCASLEPPEGPTD